MRSVPVVALDPVRDDVQAAYDYFEERLPGGGDAFLARYFATTDRIALNPETYAVKFDDYRRALVSRSNIAVYYFIEPGRAVIVATVDARRNPRLIRRLARQRRGLQ
jgi:hypothetical protein